MSRYVVARRPERVNTDSGNASCQGHLDIGWVMCVVVNNGDPVHFASHLEPASGTGELVGASAAPASGRPSSLTTVKAARALKKLVLPGTCNSTVQVASTQALKVKPPLDVTRDRDWCLYLFPSIAPIGLGSP